MRADESAPCIFPREVTRRACQKLIEIIHPTAEKFEQRRRLGFLGYGEIGWAHGFPRDQENINDKVPILNLTPPEIYQQTGMALLMRAYTHLERYNPLYHIAVGAHAWFDTAFFNPTDLRPLPIKGTLAQRIGWNPVSAGFRSLKGCQSKLKGILDPDARAEIYQRYRAPIGTLPSHVRVAQGKTIRL